MTKSRAEQSEERNLSYDSNLLFDTYKLHTELAEQVASLREGLNKLYSSMATAIVAASVITHRLAPEIETVWVFPTLGIGMSLSWIFSLCSVTGRLSAKHTVLLALEEKLPFDFLCRENNEFRSGFLRRKYTGLVMPVAFLIICVVWLFQSELIQSWCPCLGQ